MIILGTWTLNLKPLTPEGCCLWRSSAAALLHRLSAVLATFRASFGSLGFKGLGLGFRL